MTNFSVDLFFLTFGQNVLPVLRRDFFNQMTFLHKITNGLRRDHLVRNHCGTTLRNFRQPGNCNYPGEMFPRKLHWIITSVCGWGRAISLIWALGRPKQSAAASAGPKAGGRMASPRHGWPPWTPLAANVDSSTTLTVESFTRK